MSITPVSETPVEAWQAPVYRPRPAGLTPIIMSGWVTPSNPSEMPSEMPSENEDIQNPAKKRIKVCNVYNVYNAQKCETEKNDNSEVEERVREARETCAMAAAILKRY
jgi:hypothetical protein